MKIPRPEIEVINFKNEDVIVTSSSGVTTLTPSRLYTDRRYYYSKSSEYAQFGGNANTFITGWFKFMLDSQGRMSNTNEGTEEKFLKDNINYAWYSRGDGWWTFNKPYGEYGDTKPNDYD